MKGLRTAGDRIAASGAEVAGYNVLTKDLCDVVSRFALAARTRTRDFQERLSR